MTGSRLIATALVESARLVASAIAKIAHRDALCCMAYGIVMERHGALWWRKHSWNADQWAPLGMPGEVYMEPEPEAKRRTRSRRKKSGISGKTRR